MARPLRICVPDGIYHVNARGNAKEPIFLDNGDRENFLSTACEVFSRFAWSCLTYCLMGNHYHLVVRTPQSDLSRGMRQLNGVYAQRFNRRHNRCGHLFQGRFHAALVQRETYLLAVARYVALNPVRAGLCAQPEEWPWSAHRAIALGVKDTLTDGNELLAHFAEEPSKARQRYRSFISENPQEEPLLEGPILGERDFVAAHRPVPRPSPEFPELPHPAQRPTLREVLSDAEGDREITTAYRDHGYRMREIAEAIGCHYTTISRRIRAFERMAADP